MLGQRVVHHWIWFLTLYEPCRHYTKMDVTGGEAFPFATLEGLMNKLDSRELLQFAEEAKIDTSLESWLEMLLFISNFLEDAEDKQLTDRAVKSWLSKLRDLVYDAEDIVDVLYTEMLRTSVSDSDVVAGMSSEMKKITKGLEDLEKRVGKLDLKRPTEIKSNESIKEERITTSLLDHGILGREEDKEAILNLLTSKYHMPKFLSHTIGHRVIEWLLLLILECFAGLVHLFWGMGLLTGISAFGLLQWIVTSAFHEAKHNFLCIIGFSHYVTRLQALSHPPTTPTTNGRAASEAALDIFIPTVVFIMTLFKIDHLLTKIFEVFVLDLNIDLVIQPLFSKAKFSLRLQIVATHHLAKIWIPVFLVIYAEDLIP
ncbi:Rx, N-terminal [Dillenia turbinata]|uniref:Rx, N-terminal n=1 Tax=Dillenia turbinata TaxID=194707 RepID=A0AAN8VTG2_9MAGN